MQRAAAFRLKGKIKIGQMWGDTSAAIEKLVWPLKILPIEPSS